MARRLDPSSVTASLDRYFASITARRERRGLPAPQALVRAPGFEYTHGDRMLPFHAASVGKLATAALIMQEVETGRVALTSSVASLLPEAEVRGLFAEPGATVEQLLAHTSGAPDYFEGKVTGGPKFIDLVLSEPGPDRVGPAWLNDTEVSGFASITCDWAGGGIVTMLDDLARLTLALTDGRLVKPATWAMMTAARNRFRPGIRYGLGAMELRFEGFMPLLRGLPRPSATWACSVCTPSQTPPPRQP